MASTETGRRGKQEEVKLLVNLVKDRYTFLTGALFNVKTKQMVDGKWNNIANTANCLGKGAPFSTEKVKNNNSI